jgi:hypothetical protein
MSTSKPAAQILVLNDIRLQDKVYCLGGLGVLAGSVAFGVIWTRSKIRFHKSKDDQFQVPWQAKPEIVQTRNTLTVIRAHGGICDD